MSDSSESEWLTMAQAADRLGVSPPTLRRWAAQGRINACRTLGGHRRIPLSELPSLTPPEIPLPLRPEQAPEKAKRPEELPRGRAEVVEDTAQLRAEVERLEREVSFLRNQVSEGARAQAELRRVILRLVERDGGPADDEAARPGH